jgi:hypothetical protein
MHCYTDCAFLTSSNFTVLSNGHELVTPPQLSCLRSQKVKKAYTKGPNTQLSLVSGTWQCEIRTNYHNK